MGKVEVLTFQGSTFIQCTNIVIVDDSEAEDPEIFGLEFIPNFIDRATIFGFVTIYDDDGMYKE